MFFPITESASILKWAQVHIQPGEALLLLGTYRDRRAFPELIEALQCAGVTSFGGLFERVIYGTRTYERGCVAATFRASQLPCVVQGCEHGYRDLAGILPASTPDRDQTVIVFADPDLPSLATFFQQLYTHYGNSVEYLGAGTGVKANPLSTEEPDLGSLFTTESGLVSGSIVVALVDHSAGVTAKHGWTRAGGPMIASRVDDQWIYEINWRPAWDVYREAVEAVTEQPIDASEPLRQGIVGFPLGMKRAGAEDLLRLPLDVDDSGGMRCVGGVPSNAVLHLLKGIPQNLCAAASESAKESLQALGVPAGQALLVECVTRFEFMEDRFDEELHAIDRQLSQSCESPVIGMLARGELASMKGGYPQMLNKTAVVGAFQS